LAFEQFYVLTRGGPDNSTVTIVMAMFRQAFSQFDLGRAAAMAVVVLIALVAINSIQLSVLRRQSS
jgi:multiple sugar transport system permease protein